MSGQISATPSARTGDNRFLKAVAGMSTLAGWISAAMIVAAVAITCEMIWVRFVMNGSTVWQTEAVVYLMISAALAALLTGLATDRGRLAALSAAARRAFEGRFRLAPHMARLRRIYRWEGDDARALAR